MILLCYNFEAKFYKVFFLIMWNGSWKVFMPMISKWQRRFLHHFKQELFFSPSPLLPPFGRYSTGGGLWPTTFIFPFSGLRHTLSNQFGPHPAPMHLETIGSNWVRIEGPSPHTTHSVSYAFFPSIWGRGWMCLRFFAPTVLIHIAWRGPRWNRVLYISTPDF